MTVNESANTDTRNTARAKWTGPVLCAALVAIAWFREQGVVEPWQVNLASLLSIAIGVAWTARGPEPFRRLAELYLWLAFIVSLSLLRILSDGLASWMGWSEIDAFRGVAVVHVLVVVAALRALGAWSRVAGAGTHSSTLRLSAGLLIVGAVVFWVGARTFPGTSLLEVSANMAGHLWTSANFMLATAVTMVGLGLLTCALREAGDRFASRLGLGAYLFGAVFWFLHLTFRMTVMRAAAEEFALASHTPEWYPALATGSSVLFGIYSVLAYLGIVAYGVAFLRTGLLPRWIGWSCIGLGLLGAPFAGPPFFIHALLWVVALLVLREPGTPRRTELE